MAIKLSIKQAVSLLESGYVRWTKQETTPGQSLQSHFGLNTAQMQQLLKRPELKNKRTTDNTVIFEEDDVTTQEVTPIIPKDDFNVNPELTEKSEEPLNTPFTNTIEQVVTNNEAVLA